MARGPTVQTQIIVPLCFFLSRGKGTPLRMADKSIGPSWVPELVLRVLGAVLLLLGANCPPELQCVVSRASRCALI